MPVTFFTISGNAGVAGATVAYTGTASGSVTVDGSGTRQHYLNQSEVLLAASVRGLSVFVHSQTMRLGPQGKRFKGKSELDLHPFESFCPVSRSHH